ncbi:hypothetical protein FZI91_23140 [Mycobacterium sp. CBMA271]|uniref:hypothetical protein n=1 Tax=unclassified Mycobacteroides TaxID=2618759 RepID=UPI0012DFB352|nr:MULTISPECIES: hypothetical protein [unclassified Mycobacteroides]MUM18580.1 hypothetical protein [Mycobacteroides sp. CBMA 326]MUM24574.1 hypothetical protein [Mycobacteroides sp. CBMA 271]
MSNLWPPVAAAAPPGFPDLAGYTKVNLAEYAQQTIGQLFVFDTPDGLHCEITEPHYRPLQFACHGALPGVPEGVDHVLAATMPAEDFATTSKNPVVEFGAPYGATRELSGALLPPMHYITALNITCAVDGAGMTACRYRSDDGARQYGFVLSPSGSAIL